MTIEELIEKGITAEELYRGGFRVRDSLLVSQQSTFDAGIKIRELVSGGASSF